MKPVIGITSGRIYNKARPYSPYVYGQMHTYVEAVIAGGGVPIILPMIEEGPVTDQLFDMCDGIMFSGGNDITPSHYGQELTYTHENDELRDTFELSLLERAAETNKPILGICRGMQLMNVYRGGALYQEVTEERPDTKNHDGYLEVESTEHIAHQLEIEADSQLAKILGKTKLGANTHHHQAIKDVGRDLRATAYAEDGVVEGLEDTSKDFFVGVQCHPESIFQRAEPKWSKLFESFVEAAKTYRGES